MSKAQLKDSRVGAGTLNHRGGITAVEKTEEEAKKERFVVASARKTRSTLLQDQIANSDICMQNRIVPKGHEMFPCDPRMQVSKLYYPYAEGGELHMDLPATEYEIACCQRKEKTLLEQGSIRYTYISHMDSIHEVGPRLAAFDKAFKKRIEKEAKAKELIK